MTQPTTGKMSYKRYKCKCCGYEKKIQTNHWGECYSFCNDNICPKCPPFARPNTWICQEIPPEGVGITESWSQFTPDDVENAMNILFGD